MVTQATQRADIGTHDPIVAKVAKKYSVDSDSLLQTLKATAFRQSGDKIITNEQMYALLIVSDQYNLNPFTKEIYAFPDKFGGIVPVVSVDGWNRIANEHPYFDGVEFEYSTDVIKPEGAKSHCHAWIETVLYRNDRKHPTRVREYLDECYRQPFKDWYTGEVSLGPWQTHPKRMLRHKSQIQCYRIGFGFVGIYDEDEALRIIENGDVEKPQNASVVDINKANKTTGQARLEEIPASTVEGMVKPQEEVFDQKFVDDFVVRLCKRASKTNQWQAAKDLIDERFTGDANAYAHQKISDEHSKQVQPDNQVAPVNESGDLLQQAELEPEAKVTSRIKAVSGKVSTLQAEPVEPQFF